MNPHYVTVTVKFPHYAETFKEPTKTKKFSSLMYANERTYKLYR